MCRAGDFVRKPLPAIHVGTTRAVPFVTRESGILVSLNRNHLGSATLPRRLFLHKKHHVAPPGNSETGPQKVKHTVTSHSSLLFNRLLSSGIHIIAVNISLRVWRHHARETCFHDTMSCIIAYESGNASSQCSKSRGIVRWLQSAPLQMSMSQGQRDNCFHSRSVNRGSSRCSGSCRGSRMIDWQLYIPHYVK